MIGIDEESGQQKRADFKADDILVKGRNMQSGSCTFVSSKKTAVTFPFAFLKTPRIALTLMSNATAPAYTTSVSKTGFTINFQTNFTGEVEWTALERE